MTLINFRYELPQPSANQKTDISAWNECIRNSMAQLEHQATRLAFFVALKSENE